MPTRTTADQSAAGSLAKSKPALFKAGHGQLWHKSQDADLIILGTAPTGHTLRSSSLPQGMEEWMDVFGSSLKRHRTSSRMPFAPVKDSLPQVGGGFVDEFVKDLRAHLEGLGSLLKNGQQGEFVPVTIPEPVSIEENKDLVSALEEMNIPVRNTIINRIEESEECPFCSSKREEQLKYAQQAEGMNDYLITEIPLQPNEISGINDLTEFSEIMYKAI